MMNTGDWIAEVDGVSKKFCRHLHRSLRYGLVDLGRETLGLPAQAHLRRGEFFAVRDMSFRIGRGESIALLGPNGAGKSTLVKMLNGLLKPTTGAIRLRGRVTALTTLGAGFNPVLSGRENIYINAAVLGFSARQVETRYRDMMDFAEIEDAIDDPVKTYSSGMRARLGYAIAAFLNPDLLLLDEVLATGDRRFKLRCFEHLQGLVRQGTSVMLVSHNVGRLSRICQRAIVVDQGRVCFDGGSKAGLQKYDEVLQLRQRPTESGHSLETRPSLNNLRLLDQNDQEVTSPLAGEPLRLQIEFDCPQGPCRTRVAVHLETPTHTIATMKLPRGRQRFGRGTHRLTLRLPNPAPLRGNFFFVVQLTDPETHDVWHESRLAFQAGGVSRTGTLRLPHRWEAAATDPSTPHHDA